MTDDQQPTPVVPPAVRTVTYIVGILAGAAVTPLALAGLEVAAASAGALAGACSAIAFGYRPTRTDA